MIEDPIVEEVYKVREKLLNECGGDLRMLIERQKAITVPVGMKTVVASLLPELPRTEGLASSVSAS